MLTEMVQYSRKTEEKVKAMQNEIKENAQATNSDGKKLRLKQFGVEEINIQPE